MGQLSFFSAETEQPAYADLAGLLAAHGQAVRSETGTRVSIVVADRWRAEQIVVEIRAAGLEAEAERLPRATGVALIVRRAS